MMAYAALVSLSQTIEKMSMNPDQYSSALRHFNQIRCIDELITVLSAEDSQKEGRIRDIANEVQQVLELLISKQSRSRFGFDKYNRFLAKFRRRARFLQQLEKIKELDDAIAWELMELENGRDEIDDQLPLCDSPAAIEDEMQLGDSPAAIEDELQLSDSLAANSSSSVMEIEMNSLEFGDESQLGDLPAADSASLMTVARKISDVVGLEDDSLAIKTRLCGESSKLQVIPIVGMGGIGKTTLSRTVYNDQLTIEYFDVRVWITVSQDYSTQKIIASLMDSLKEFVVAKSGQRDEETVYKSLKGRRYLIVMDDMWSTEPWDDVRDLFPDDHNGSRIMLTTRLLDVATYVARGSPLHEMRFMDVEQSWELLMQRVFGDEDCSPELESIGLKIARSCRGLPLAVSVIGGLLSTVERNPVSWSEIADDVGSVIVKEDGPIDEILSLSYAHLPRHLRDCFLYMGGFPEDHKIRLSKLVRLWVAEGFVTGLDGSKSLEDEAEECLEDLVSRSLVLVTERKYNGRIKRCSLHDLVRDLCIRKAKEKNFFVNIMDGYVEKKHFLDSIKLQTRISVRPTSLWYISGYSCSTIRTIMSFRRYGGDYHPILLDFLKSVRLLRVFDAENDYVRPLPDALYKLFALRYLAARTMHSFRIPAVISKLQNLQTLIIDARHSLDVGRPNINSLPQEIWLMPQLRHLICYGRFPCPKEPTCTLKNLQTLSLVLHDMCVVEILENIPNIKKLGVDCSYYDYGTHLNNLECMHQLQSLELRCADWRKDSISFPKMLRKLILCNMSLPWSEMSIVGSLPNLEVLKLKKFACIGSTWETSEGEFLQLQYLLISNSKLQYWIAEECHFPMLKFLLLHECWYLNEIPEGIGEIATLELIDIRSCNLLPESLVESAKRIQEEQQSLGNDALHVHYPLPPL